MSVFEQRRDRLLGHLRKEGVAALLVTNPLNVTYLTGFTGEASYLYLSDATTLLVSDGRFVTQLAEECPGLPTHIRPPGQTIAEASGQVLDKLKPGSVGFESGHLTIADFETLRDKANGVDWKAGANRVETLRLVKDAGELEQIRGAIAIAQAAFERFRRELQPERTEKELHDAMEFAVRQAGGRSTAFPTIVAVGDRAALPHAPPTGRRLGEAAYFLLDWGARGPLYHSDLTRVLWTRKPTTQAADPLRDKLRRLCDLVQAARHAALAVLRPGVSAGDVDQAARSVIATAGYGPQFNHGLGHGIGLQIHEGPFFRPGNPMLLEAGMVVTLEPGVYLPGEVGVRIEDDVLITPDGPQILTSVPETPDELLAVA
jgi:Xaa-Pro aminopeptidase